MNNEKYLEFSLQSERYAHGVCGFCGHPDYNLTRNKKFAELIVQECIAKTMEMCDTAIDNEWHTDETFHMITDNLREHFGIEE